MHWFRKLRPKRRKECERAPSETDRSIALGHAFSFVNEDLKLDLYGSPFEILTEIRRSGLDINGVAHERMTEIKMQCIRQEQPKLEFSGGPHAEGVMTLMDALESSDFETAEAALRDAPEVLSGEHTGAHIPLIGFAASGMEESVRFLLDHRAAPDGVVHFDMTPLHWAAGRDHKRIVDLLIEAGADPTRLSWFFLTPAEIACLNGHEELAARLRAKSPEFYRREGWMAVLKRMGIRE